VARPIVPSIAPPLTGLQAKDPTAASQQIASLPPAGVDEGRVLESGDLYRIPFAADTSEIPPKNSKLLDKLAKRMEIDQSLRLQLLGFASSTGASASKARRVSLFRALSIRTYLMKKGIRSTRMDVRALGSKSDSAAPDRVDIRVKK
jgi:outer membrane protein OmpA-like peptidoglycan-associated protein